jgi:3-dehydroquinate synthase
MGARRSVAVSLAHRSYEILIGPGLLDEAGGLIAPLVGKRKAIIVTDETVGGLYARALEASLDAAGIARGATVTLPPGEGTKSFSQFERLCEAILAQGIDRAAHLIALGGGVIGDLVGFTAASLLRGIDFIQIPTTLLSQVDSSVGGKTGINATHGKNLVGAFHQPRLVLADTGALTSLPPREVKAGYAEVLKYGLIRDRAFFDWLETNGGAVLALAPEPLAQAVAVSCAAKAAVVAADERETGDRALLNLGHTFGHALEAAYGFSDRLLHGEAVAIGMGLAFDLSAAMGLCPQEDAQGVRAHLEAHGLMTHVRDLAPLPSVEFLLSAMAKDKKAAGGKITFILARGIGDAFIAKDVPLEPVQSLLEKFLARQ